MSGEYRVVQAKGASLGITFDVKSHGLVILTPGMALGSGGVLGDDIIKAINGHKTTGCEEVKAVVGT